MIENKNFVAYWEKEYFNCDFFTTGYTDLDSFLMNIKGGNIITIGGRPAMGKTNFLLPIIDHLAEENKRVAVFCLEYSKEQFLKRLLMYKADIYPYLNKGLSSDDFKKLAEKMEEYSKSEIYLCDRVMLTVEELEEKVKELKPEVVFIDYVQLLQMPKAPNLTEATNLAIHELKRIATENNVIMFVTSQLSRAVESRVDKHPVLSDLRNGSLLEELSDVVLMIYRDEYYNVESIAPHSAEIIVMKNKYGPTGTVNLTFKNGKFSNWTVEGAL